MIDVLVEAGDDVHGRDEAGITPLRDAAYRSNQGAVLALLSHGAEVDAEDMNEETPLHVAAWNAGAQGTEIIVEVLLKHGADVNAKDSRGDTPLHSAAWHVGQQGTAQVVDVLLRWGADETMVGWDGETPVDAMDDGIVEKNYLAPEDVEQVRKLLANAPIDRAWRRRGYLTMCRAHLGRLQLKQERPAINDDLMPRTFSQAMGAGAEENVSCGPSGGGTGYERTDGDWMDVVVKVVGFEEEGFSG